MCYADEKQEKSKVIFFHMFFPPFFINFLKTIAKTIFVSVISDQIKYNIVQTPAARGDIIAIQMHKQMRFFEF